MRGFRRWLAADWDKFALVALAVIGLLQWLSFRSQTEVQQRMSQPNISPEYIGMREDKKLVVRFANGGPLPALGMRVASRADVKAPLSPQELAAFCAETEEPSAPLIVHPGASIENHFGGPNFDLNKELGEELYYICGYAVYTDAYESKHRSQFCFNFNRNEIKTEDDHTICSLPESIWRTSQ